MAREPKFTILGLSSRGEKDPRKDASGREEAIHFQGKWNNWAIKVGGEIFR
jgi:hypothetical protein